jgi:hypothetical protein
MKAYWIYKKQPNKLKLTLKRLYYLLFTLTAIYCLANSLKALQLLIQLLNQ